MQNIIIAKPYEFVPPARGAFWPAVFRPLLRPYLARAWGVTRFDIGARAAPRGDPGPRRVC